nr:TonB-dependent receptor [Prevotella sp.]
MYKQLFNKRSSILFKSFSNKHYSLFAVLGREVLVGTLSVATLSNAKAGGISTDVEKVTTDSTFKNKEFEIDEVQVTGTRAPLAENQQARMVTVLSKEDIQSAPVQSINDLLKYAVGVDVRQRGPIGAQTDVSIRGGNYEQITILLNGINICDPQTGHNAFDFPVDISDIERIEVLEGPAGRVYGTSSLLGAINIVTKIPSKSSVDAHISAGSYGYANIGTRVNIAKGKWNNSISGSYTRSDGYNRSKDGNLNMDYDGGKAFFQGTYNDDMFLVKYHAGISTKGYGSNSFYSSYSDEQYERTTKTYTALQAENKQGALHLKSSIYWNRNYDRFELFRDAPDKYPFNYHRTDVYGLNLNSYFNWALGKTAIGAEIRNEDLISGNLGEKLSTPKHIHGTDRYYEYGLNRTNIQFEIEHNIILNRFTLSAGLVMAKNSWAEMNMKVYPGADISYRISNAWKVFASYNSSLRMPSVTELYYNSKGYNANKNLKPEELSAIEIGSRYQSRFLQANVKLFHNDMKNLIDWIIDNNADSAVLTTTNFGKIKAIGLETNFSFDMKEILPNQHFIKKIDFSYAYTNQDQKKYEGITSRYVLEYLRHKIVASVLFNPIKDVELYINYRYQKRNGSYSAGYDDETNSYILKKYSPYSVVDAKLTWTLSKFKTFIEVNNLTSHHYYDFGSLKQPGIWVMAGLSMNMDL